MITLIFMAAFALLSCLAAAGLIASTQNSADAARSLGGIALQSDKIDV